jgi:hypothetical protein
MEQVSKVQVMMAVLAVVVVVEMVLQTMPEVAMVILHQLHHLKVMMVAVEVAVELTHGVAVQAAEVLAQSVATLGMTQLLVIMMMAVMVGQVQLLQSQVHL